MQILAMFRDSATVKSNISVFLYILICVSMRVTVCTYKSEQQPRLASH